MRWQAPPRLAFLSWLLVLGAMAPLVVVKAEAGGCNHIEGVEGTWSQCTDAEQTLTYRALGLKLEQERTVDGKPAEGAAWTSWWLERSGPLSFAMGLTGATAVASAAVFPLAHRRSRRPATAWWTMALALAVFLLVALGHARLNGAQRGWPSWGMALAVAGLASGLVLRRPAGAPGPMPSLPTFG